MMGSKLTCNWLALCSLLLNIVSFFMLVVGVATDGWVNKLISLDEESYSYYFKGRETPAGSAAYALDILAVISCFVGILLRSIYLGASQNGSRNKVIKKFKLVIACLSGFGCACGIICCIVFGVTFYLNGPYRPDYSFYVTIVGSAILLIAGAMSYKSKYKIRDPPNRTVPVVAVVVNNNNNNSTNGPYDVHIVMYPADTQPATTDPTTWGQPQNMFGDNAYAANGNWQSNYAMPPT